MKRKPQSHAPFVVGQQADSDEKNPYASIYFCPQSVSSLSRWGRTMREGHSSLSLLLGRMPVYWAKSLLFENHL